MKFGSHFRNVLGIKHTNPYLDLFGFDIFIKMSRGSVFYRTWCISYGLVVEEEDFTSGGN